MNQTIKTNLIALSLLLCSQIYSSQNDTSWIQESNEEYLYHKDSKAFPADTQTSIESTITISQHYFNSGITRVKTSYDMQNDGFLIITTETWTTNNPSYITWKNGLLVCGIIGMSSLLIINQDLIKDLLHASADVQPVAQPKTITEFTNNNEATNIENNVDTPSSIVASEIVCENALEEDKSSKDTVTVIEENPATLQILPTSSEIDPIQPQEDKQATPLETIIEEIFMSPTIKEIEPEVTTPHDNDKKSDDESSWPVCSAIAPKKTIEPTDTEFSWPSWSPLAEKNEIKITDIETQALVITPEQQTSQVNTEVRSIMTNEFEQEILIK